MPKLSCRQAASSDCSAGVTASSLLQQTADGQGHRHPPFQRWSCEWYYSWVQTWLIMYNCLHISNWNCLCHICYSASSAPRLSCEGPSSPTAVSRFPRPITAPTSLPVQFKPRHFSRASPSCLSLSQGPERTGSSSLLVPATHVGLHWCW